MDKRILLLRTFRDVPEDDLDIALLANICGNLGKLIIVGSKIGNLEIAQSLSSTGAINTQELAEFVEFLEATDDAWRKTIIEQLLDADAVIIRFTPKSIEFPKLMEPNPMINSNFYEYYQTGHQNIHSGVGLLSEIAFCSRLGLLKKCLLLVNEWQVQELEKVMRLTSLGTGDIFSTGDIFEVNGAFAMRPQRPRFTALDFQIASLRDVGSALALPERNVLFSSVEYINLIAGEIGKRLRGIINSDTPKLNIEARQNQNYLDYGISNNPKKVFPDYELKVIKHTPVENLLALSPGQLIEVDYNTVIEDYGLEPNNALCPYCQSKKELLFFYQYGHTISKTSPIRCKCQFCTRRSTLMDGILMDQ